LETLCSARDAAGLVRGVQPPGNLSLASPQQIYRRLREIGRAVFLASLMLLMMGANWALANHHAANSRFGGLNCLVLIVSMRVLLRLNLRRLRLHGHNIKKLLIVGGDHAPAGCQRGKAAN